MGEKVKIAKKQKKELMREEKASTFKDLQPSERIGRSAAELRTSDGMMEEMGEKISEEMLDEISDFLAVHLNTASQTQSVKKVRSSTPEDEMGNTEEKTLKDMIEKRNSVLLKVDEAKSTLAKYANERVKVENKLFSKRQSQSDLRLREELEMEWRSFDETIRSIHMNIAKLESKAKNLTMNIMKMTKLKEKPTKSVDSDLPSKQTETTPTNIKETLKSGKLVEKDLLGDLGQNVKISISKISNDDDFEETSDEIYADESVSKLEDLIKKQLAGHAFNKRSKDVEIKLIAVRLPDIEEEDWQLNTMMYKMMTGDVKGYEDVEQAREDEANYGFNWKEDMLINFEKNLALKQAKKKDDSNSNQDLTVFKTRIDGSEDTMNTLTDSVESKTTTTKSSFGKLSKTNSDINNLEFKIEEKDIPNKKKKVIEEFNQDAAELVAKSLSELFGIENVKIVDETSDAVSKRRTKLYSDDKENKDEKDMCENVFIDADIDNADFEIVFNMDEESDDLETAFYLLDDDLDFELDNLGEKDEKKSERKDEL